MSCLPQLSKFILPPVNIAPEDVREHDGDGRRKPKQYLCAAAKRDVQNEKAKEYQRKKRARERQKRLERENAPKNTENREGGRGYAASVEEPKMSDEGIGSAKRRKYAVDPAMTQTQMPPRVNDASGVLKEENFWRPQPPNMVGNRDDMNEGMDLPFALPAIDPIP